MQIRGVFVGLSTVDLVYSVETVPKSNTKIVAQRQESFAGGPATNAAVTFAYLGGAARLITAVGRHPLTTIIRHELSRFDVSLQDLLPEVDVVPTVSSILVTERTGERTVISANAGQLPGLPDSFDTSSIDGAAVLLMDGHHMPIGLSAAKSATTCGVRVVLDGGSWKPGTEELLRHVDVAICSQNFHPPGTTGENSILDYVLKQGPSAVAITKGERPIRFVCGSDSGEMPVPRVHAIDTLGAGDIFHGAFCHRMASGGAFREISSSRRRSPRGPVSTLAHGPGCPSRRRPLSDNPNT